MKELLALLEYNFWANDQFILRLKEQYPLPDAIGRQVSHLLSAHRIWLHRINGRGTLPSVWGEVEVNTWEGVNIELYNETADLVKSNPLDQIISYKNSKGHTFETSLQDILFHVLHHSTHHRAQVALLMRQNQILPPVSDYIFYLRR